MTTPDEVNRLVERLRDLNEALYEDAGTYLTADCVLRALDFAARYTEPDAVSADSSGGISFSWVSWGNELSVQFTCGGQTHWAGVTPDGVRPYGSGEPDPSQWPCLRADAGPDRRDWEEHEMTTPETGHPLLQALIDSISVFDGAACWDFAAMYAVRDALSAQAAPAAQPVGNEIDSIRAIDSQQDVKLEPSPPTLVEAMDALRAALHSDHEYAWSWHCNIAMAAVDAGCDRVVANEGAARFLEALAGINTRDFDEFKALFPPQEPEAARRAPPAAQPVAWMWQHPETGHTGFVENCTDEDRQQWERVNRPRVFVCPLYASPQADEQHTKSQLKRIAAQKGEKPLRAASPQADTQPEEKPE